MLICGKVPVLETQKVDNGSERPHETASAGEKLPHTAFGAETEFVQKIVYLFDGQRVRSSFRPLVGLASRLFIRSFALELDFRSKTENAEHVEADWIFGRARK